MEDFKPGGQHLISLLKRFLEGLFNLEQGFVFPPLSLPISKGTDSQDGLLCSGVPQGLREVSHSHCQVHLTAFLSRSMEFQGDSSTSLRPEVQWVFVWSSQSSWQPEEDGAECVLGMEPRALVAGKTDRKCDWRPRAGDT